MPELRHDVVHCLLPGAGHATTLHSSGRWRDGHCQPGIAKGALGAGFDHYLVKPVYFPEVFEILKPVAQRRGCSLVDIGLPGRYGATTLSPPCAQ
jgi:hypothetical protein